VPTIGHVMLPPIETEPALPDQHSPILSFS
jgi:hypothetical protein